MCVHLIVILINDFSIINITFHEESNHKMGGLVIVK